MRLQPVYSLSLLFLDLFIVIYEKAQIKVGTRHAHT